MIVRKKECLRQNIRKLNWKLQKSVGQVEWVMGLFLLLFLGILLSTLLQMQSYRATSLYLEDALAASNLASAVISVEEYGISHTILIENPLEAYNRYCTAVSGNLNLNEQWEGTNGALISGKVKIEKYIIYNVRDNTVTVHSMDAGGQLTTWQGSLGTVKAPNDIMITSTSVYSELSFPVEGIMGINAYAHKGKLVDIVSQYG